MAENALKFDFLGVDHVTPTTEKVGRGFSGLESKVGRFAKASITALKGVSVGAVGLGIAGATMGIKTAAGLEQAQVGFTSLLGSGKKAQDFLKNLKSFAATTPFELPGLVDSSRTLIGVGLSAKQTMGVLKAFGNAASAVGVGQEAFQRIMLATSQAVSAGKFGIEDLNQITENGIPIWKILADATGKPVKELRNMATAGKLLASDVLPLLQKQMNKDYGGAMEKQSMTLNGLWSTFMDTLNLGLADAITPLIPALKTGLAGATRTVSEALKGLPTILRNVQTHLTVVRDFIVDKVVPGVTGAIDTLKSRMPKLDVGNIISKDLETDAKNWAFRIQIGLMAGFRDQNWQPLGKVIGDGASQGLLAAGNLGIIVGKWFGSVDWFSLGKKAGLAALPFIIGFVSNFGSNFISVAKEHPFDTFLFVASFLAVGKLGGVIAKVLERIPFLRAFAPLFRGIEGMTGPLNRIIGKFFNFFGKFFREGFLEAFPKLEGLLGKKLRGMAETISIRWLIFRDAAEDIMQGLIRGFGRQTGNLTKAVYRIIRTIVNPYADAAQWLYYRGKQIIAGLRDGMLGYVSGAGRWARQIGGRIVGAIKSYFGIRSPSRLMAGIGSNLIMSMMNSMLSHNPVQMITKIFGGMPQALGALVDKGVVNLASLPGKAMNALSGLGGKYAKKIAGLFGGGGGGGNLKGDLSSAERWIIMHESGGRTNAQNPTSTAFGLGQLIYANRVAYGARLGVSANTTDYGAQLAMFRMYVRERYGTAENAQAFWQAHHWYDRGGEATGSGFLAKKTLAPERVLSPGQTRDFNHLVRVLDRGLPTGGSENHYHFPNYVGSHEDLATAIERLDQRGRLDRVVRKR